MARRNRWLERVVAELRAPVPDDGEGPRRIMDAVRRLPPPETRIQKRRAADSGWRWWLRPRPIMVRPAVAVLWVALTMAVVLVGSLLPRGTAPPESVGVGGVPVVDFALQSMPFVFVDESATEVSLVGDFNDWDPTATLMVRQGADGIWVVVVPLPPGRHVYSFVVDGKTWLPADGAPRVPADEFGTPGSVILVDDEA
ncbi:MAG: isoamylase early set domain-containing protein [Candidatus Eisenbacteria sp.]|nr:isoamylase early set domain-containing protein [Candidatus Eisenbacteria bacterium]